MPVLMKSRQFGQLERQRRRAARVALYSSLVLVLTATFALISLLERPPAQQPSELWIRADYAHLPEVRLLQSYVQIDTSKSTGDEVAGARFLAAQLEKAGVHPRIELLGGKHANLYALLPGKDPRPLVLHSHIDVSDADPKQWFYPPFAGHIELPWIYGRGTFDMKSVGIAELLAFIDLARSGKPLRRSVLLLATGGEESGSLLGTRWVIRRHPDLVRTFWAVLTEGGTVEARTRADVKYWGTEVGQKHYAEMKVCGSDRERLEQLRKDLLAIGPTETDLRLIPQVREVLASYQPSRDSAELRRLLARPDELLSDISAFRKLPPFLRSMLRNEAFPFPVEEAEGGGYELPIKFQLLPGQPLAAVRDQLVPPWLLSGLTFRIEDEAVDQRGSPTSNPVFQQLVRTVRQQYPQAPAGPFFLATTATDARFFRAAGVPTYGFSPFLIMNTDTLQVDDANERLALTGFVQGVELYRRLLADLAA